MTYSSMSIHDIKNVELKKRETLEEDGSLRFTTLDIEFQSKEGTFRLTAFLNKGDDGYNIDLI